MLTPEQLQEHADRYAGSSDGEAQDARALLQHIREQEARAAANTTAITDAQDLLALAANDIPIGEPGRSDVVGAFRILSAALDSTTAGQSLLDRLHALEESLEPFAALYTVMERIVHPDHLEADLDKPAYGLDAIDEQGGLCSASITPADLHRARAMLQNRGVPLVGPRNEAPRADVEHKGDKA